MTSKRNNQIIVAIICAAGVAIVAMPLAFATHDKRMKMHSFREAPHIDSAVLSDYFPLAPRNRWDFAGPAANIVLGGDIIEKPVRLTMEVKDVLEFGDDVSLCIMSGHPGNAAWVLKPEHSKEHVVTVRPKKYGYLVVSNKIFFISENKLAPLTECLKKPPAHQAKDCWFDGNFLNQDHLEFEFPLFKGQRFGPTTWLARQDKRYFWYVKDRFEKCGLEGSLAEGAPEFELVYYTFPGRVELRFVPYVGIVAWKYVHHGTKAEVDMSLVDYDIHLDP